MTKSFPSFLFPSFLPSSLLTHTYIHSIPSVLSLSLPFFLSYFLPSCSCLSHALPVTFFLSFSRSSFLTPSIFILFLQSFHISLPFLISYFLPSCSCLYHALPVTSFLPSFLPLVPPYSPSTFILFLQSFHFPFLSSFISFLVARVFLMRFQSYPSPPWSIFRLFF